MAAARGTWRKARPACPRCGEWMTTYRFYVKCYACGYSRETG